MRPAWLGRNLKVRRGFNRTQRCSAELLPSDSHSISTFPLLLAPIQATCEQHEDRHGTHRAGQQRGESSGMHGRGGTRCAGAGKACAHHPTHYHWREPGVASLPTPVLLGDLKSYALDRLAEQDDARRVLVDLNCAGQGRRKTISVCPTATRSMREKRARPTGRPQRARVAHAGGVTRCMGGERHAPSSSSSSTLAAVAAAVPRRGGIRSAPRAGCGGVGLGWGEGRRGSPSVKAFAAQNCDRARDWRAHNIPKTIFSSIKKHGR